MHNLNDAIHAFARRLRPDAAVQAITELDHLIAGTQQAHAAATRTPYASDAVKRYLPPMLAQSPSPVTTALAAVWDQLDWHYGYPERADAPGLGERVSFAELVGPQAPLVATDIRVGFTFMAPGVLYPAHAHPAYELYVVLSGRALWTQTEIATWQDLGAVIVHDSEESHTMQTAAEPLLALYSWRGDIMVSPYYV